MDMEVQPPASDEHCDMKTARSRLAEHPRHYLVSQKLCRLVETDLNWLAHQEKVMGPGSVVRLRRDEAPSGEPLVPTIIIRPTTRHTYKEATLHRELHYVVELTEIVAATDILEEVVLTTWPMTGTTFIFTCRGNPDPHNLGDAEMRVRAKELGWMAEGNDDRMRKTVSRTSADQYVGQYHVQVQEAWDRAVRLIEKNFAAPVVAQNARPDEEPAKDEQQKATQQDSGASMLGLMKTAASKKRAGETAAASQKKKSKTTKMRRIDYGEPIMPKKDAPSAERSESTGEIMAKLERCNALGLQVGSLPPPTTSTSSTVQAAPAAPRPKGAARARRTNRAPKKSADEIMAEANAEAAAMG